MIFKPPAAKAARSADDAQPKLAVTVPKNSRLPPDVASYMFQPSAVPMAVALLVIAARLLTDPDPAGVEAAAGLKVTRVHGPALSPLVLGEPVAHPTSRELGRVAAAPPRHQSSICLAMYGVTPAIVYTHIWPMRGIEAGGTAAGRQA